MMSCTSKRLIKPIKYTYRNGSFKLGLISAVTGNRLVYLQYIIWGLLNITSHTMEDYYGIQKAWKNGNDGECHFPWV